MRPLAKEGAFDNPPEPEMSDDGYLVDTYWPEMDYLTRVAADAPTAVVDVLLKLGASHNAWVRRGVFEIGASIPANEAARLQPLIKSWRSTGLGWRTDPKSLVSLAMSLLQGGEQQVGRWFADLLFKPSRSKTEKKADLVLDDYWYQESLPGIAQALGPDGLGLVLSWLVRYERTTGRLTRKSDITYLYRESIRQGTDELDPLEQVLIDAVRDLAAEAMRTDVDAAIDMLLNTKMLLARKIALFSLGNALSQSRSGDKGIEHLLSVASSLLSEDESGDESCRIDYAELARAVARSTGEDVPEVAQRIDAGPRADADRIRDWMRHDAMDEAQVDERVQDYLDRWKHRWLSAIGGAALSARLQSELAELDSRYGVIDEPLAPTKGMGSWTGPNSPLSLDEMSAMSADELVAHLESWHYTGDGWGPEPSHEGQGHTLTRYLTTNPRSLEGVDHLVDRLRPTYLRAILHGWEAALKAGIELGWTQVAEVTHDVLAHDDESDIPAEGRRDWDDDLTFRPSKEAAVGLLEELAQNRRTPAVPAEALSQFAQMLISLAADNSAWADYASKGEGSGMDALTASLNWQWSTRLRGLIHLMSHGKDTEWYEAARSALETELTRDDPHGASSAVIGEGLARLLNVDPDWVTERSQAWFGSGSEISVAQQVALTTAMAVHHYHPSLYSLLSTPMVSAIELPQPIVAGWNHPSDPLQRIGEWAIDAVIRGDRTMDDPVAYKFFAASPARVRGDAIGHIAWAFMHAEAVDDEIRDRFADLWDARAAHVRVHIEDQEELSGFYWFVKSKKFPVWWWLPRLKEAAELCQGIRTERYFIGKEVAAAADTDPRGAFDVLKILLEARDEAGLTTYDLTRNAVPIVIARALAADDKVLNQEAMEYMNHLGEMGYITLEDDVQRATDGRITQGDVDG